MGFKRVLKAAFKISNLLLLAGVVVISVLTGYLPFMLIGTAGYLYFVIQAARNTQPSTDDSWNEKAARIQELNNRCDALYDQIRRLADRQYIERIKGVMEDKQELLSLFKEKKDDFVRQKISEQGINLTAAYIKLIATHNHRRNELNMFEKNEIMDRINSNERRIQFLKDTQAIEDMKQSIEMDRELLVNIEDGKKELERIAAKLTYIESTMSNLKHQAIASQNSGSEDPEIESVINEASALDNVLDKQRENRIIS